MTEPAGPNPFSTKSCLIGIGVLFAVLQSVGISLTLVVLVLFNLTTSLDDLTTTFWLLREIGIPMMVHTAIPTAIFAALVVWFGFRPNRQKPFWRTLVLCASLAVLITAISFPLSLIWTNDWQFFTSQVRQEPTRTLGSLAIVFGVAIFTGLLAAFVVRRFFQILDRRQRELSSS